MLQDIALALQPYAATLSHELRTPLHGIVAMLDVMHTNIQDTLDSQSSSAGHDPPLEPDSPALLTLLRELRANVEVMQESSRRAVDAADNVVHAYEMGMRLPERPVQLAGEEEVEEEVVTADGGDMRDPNEPRKRKHFDDGHPPPTTEKKKRKSQSAPDRLSLCVPPPPSQEVEVGLREAEHIQSHAQTGATWTDAPTREDSELAKAGSYPWDRCIVPGLRDTDLRELLQFVINEGLKHGRPLSTVARATDDGQMIEQQCERYHDDGGGGGGAVRTRVIEWAVDAGVPATVCVHAKDLSKLVSCVFLNAVKFTQQDGGRVRIAARVHASGRLVSIVVADNGPGMPAAFLPKLFTPFSREDASTTRYTEGLGLGLLVAKGIARKMGGDLTCNFAETQGPRRGSEFEIRVPVAARSSPSPSSSSLSSPRPATPLPLSPTSLPTTTTPASLATQPPHLTPTRRRLHDSLSPTTAASASAPPRTVLVADDNPINRALLRSMLRRLGPTHVLEARDGVEAVRLARAHGPARIHLVLMDLWMPRLDGYDAAARIRALPEASASPPSLSSSSSTEPTPSRPPHDPLPIVAVTADVTAAAREKALIAGMCAVLTKPYTLVELRRVVETVCAAAPAPAAPEERGRGW